MDYQAFFNDVVKWINQTNELAMKYGMESNDFWSWVTRSTGELCNKYHNNSLVIKQMVMLHDWLEEIYFKNKNSAQGVKVESPNNSWF